MRRISLTMVLVLFSLSLASTLSAQQAASASVPNLIRYTGTLKNAEGSVISSSAPVGVTFAIYKQQDGGAAVWQEIQNVAPDINGQYSVLLGSTTATGLPDDLFSSQDERWLGVQVQGQEEQARVLLVSVPYAFKAHEADTLGGLPASAFMQAAPASASASGSTPAGSVVSASNSTGATSNSKAAPGSKTKAPCPAINNYLIFWQPPGPGDDCPSSVFESTTTGTNGYIGILNGAPAQALDVTGTINDSQWYDLFEQPVLAAGSSSASTNLFVGFFAGNGTSSGTNDTFVGRESAYNNSSGSFDSFYGYRSGYHNTTGGSNTLIGYQAGFENNTGGSNTYVGRSSAFKGNGSNNVCIGYAACYNNTVNDSTFVGTNAGVANTSGLNNSFLGFAAGSNITTQSGNTFMGDSAGLGVAGSSECCSTMVGDHAGANSNGGDYFGYEAGINSTGGGVFMGYKSGFNNLDGIYNAFFGVNAGFYNQHGNQNTYLGSGAGSSVNTTSGSNNIFVGFAAGNAENNVSNNIEIGFNGPISTGSNTTVIGTPGVQTAVFLAGIAPSPPSGANTVYVSNNQLFQGPASAAGVGGNCSSGLNYITKWLDPTDVQCSSIYENTTAGTIGPQVGIGTAATFQSGPSAKLEIAYSDLVTTQNPNPSAVRLINHFQSGTDFTQTGIMYNSSVNGANEDVVRTYGVWDGTAVYQGRFAVALKDDTGTFGDVLNVTHHGPNIGGCCGGGYVGINTDSQLATLDVNGGTATNDPIGNVRIFELDPFVSGQSQSVCRNTSTFVLSLCAGSSRRFKEQIADMGDSSSKLFQLHPVTFFYKPQYDDGSHQLQHGLIAEEVAKVYPDLVEYQKDGQPYTVKYQMLTPLLLNELQKEHVLVMSQQEELQSQLQQINSQRQEINSLKHDLQLQNASLQERLEKLESYVATQMKTASDVHPAATTATNGESQ